MGRLETLRAKDTGVRLAANNDDRSGSAAKTVLSATSPVFSPRSPVLPPTLQDSSRTTLSPTSPIFSPRSPIVAPPRITRAYRWQPETFRFRGIHATESQGYWRSFPEPCSGSDGDGTEVSTDAIATGIEVGPTCTGHDHEEPRVDLLQHLAQSVLASLEAKLRDFQQQPSSIAEAYRNFGLLFHSFPAYVVWNPALQPEVRGFARANFLVSEGHPLPDIIQTVSMMSYAVRVAAAELQKPLGQVAHVQRVQGALALAERLVAEATATLELLGDAVEVFCRMRTILWADKGNEYESNEQYRRRARAYRAWAFALPMICWEGIRQGEAEGWVLRRT